MSNLEENPRKVGRAFVAWGGIFIAVSIVAFIYGFVWLNLSYIPTHQGPSEDLPAILVLMKPIYIELFGFVLGIILTAIGFSKRRSPET